MINTRTYSRLFEAPGSAAFTAGSVLARLPMAMAGVSLVVMIATVRGSYALAGAVSAAGLAAGAVGAPLVARLVDRHGQARVAVPATVVSVAAGLLLVPLVHYDAPTWTLFAVNVGTATAPNTGGMARARWAHLYRDAPDRLHAANSFEQVADEVCFMAGPVLAAFLGTALFPEAGTLVTEVLLLAGVLLFAAQRRTEPPVEPRQPGGSPRIPGLAGVVGTFACTGVIFGALEVTTVAFTDAHGHASAAGVALALEAAGSCVAGLLYGLAKPTGTAAGRFVTGVGTMAALMALPLLARASGSVAALSVALFAAGLATAPTMVNGMALVQERVPAARLNEGMTLAVTGILAGIAAGTALGGTMAEHFGPGTGYGYGIPVVAGALALVTAVAAMPASRRQSA
ncbi:MFS transporter [Streptomyces sp. NBC_01262]|uniref:MFS transporter n=1 Tax=Streptomyces sp. NBC_01262 TaxID=2903803 RepID=UPI002E35CEF8|nr:MFS transporter [Streptomyces sp. NBC_01262]